MKLNKKLLFIPLGLGALTFMTAGSCDTAHESAPDVPSSQVVQLDKEMAVQAPDGFRNVLYGCLPNTTTELFITSRGSGSSLDPAASSIAVLDNAKYCGGTGNTTVNTVPTN